MASMKYHKDCKRWRVFWHVTLPNGEVDIGAGFECSAVLVKISIALESRNKVKSLFSTGFNYDRA